MLGSLRYKATSSVILSEVKNLIGGSEMLR
jgi:hypothetical protein